MAEPKIQEKLVEMVRVPMLEYSPWALGVVVAKCLTVIFAIMIVMIAQCTNEDTRIEHHTLEMIIVSTPYEKRAEAVAAMCPQKVDTNGNKVEPKLEICKTLIQLWGEAQNPVSEEQ